MTISVITLFPEVLKPLINSSIPAKAQREGKVKINLVNLRDFGIGSHRQVDDRPYGGGVGMVLRVDVIAKAIQKAKSVSALPVRKTRTILLTPQGKVFNQKAAKRLSKKEGLILICGHYEGVDERVRKLVDEEISIGDYILSGGEAAAMVILDAVTRLIPGVLEKEATQNESFSRYTVNHKQHTLLESPQYTRPEKFRGMEVPKELLSGNHQKIKEWRLNEAVKKTKKRRGDLLAGGDN
jgi:tRNA (guanine37-N1)-methyltransferase